MIQWYIGPSTDNTEWYVALTLAADVWGGVGGALALIQYYTRTPPAPYVPFSKNTGIKGYVPLYHIIGGIG